MIKTLRTRLLIGLTPLLAILVGLGVWAIVMFTRLGGNIDTILRENYRSVLAAETMKEALERMDSALLFAIGGREDRARAQFAEWMPVFRENLRIESENITLPGEGELASNLTTLTAEYEGLSRRFFGLAASPPEARSGLYFAELLPASDRIREQADRVQEINQANMEEMDRRARAAASVSTRLMIGAVVGASLVATLVTVLLGRSILEPIRAVTRGVRAMARGDLDQVVSAATRDELGELAAAFNAMARTIREFREAGTARRSRARQTAQATIDSFPDPVVVLDLAGAVERANPAARRVLGVAPTAEGMTPWSPPPALKGPTAGVLGGGPDDLPTGLDHAITLRDGGQEVHFLPRILGIRDDQGVLLGAAVVLTDVTRFRLMDQLKSDMVSTVSHELKTPLTGMQMAVHLLLEEVVGPLNPKQLELLLAARQDSDRLLGMVNDLLDLTRIEQGRLALALIDVAPIDLARETSERFGPQAEDAGVALTLDVAADLPATRVDRERIGHVFGNLVGNALAHTGRGGSVTLGASADGPGRLRFRVADTGEGIGPEHLPRVFEKFYRVPGRGSRGGAGLGLAIAREIVEAHGGQIDATSRLGSGTTFTFTLPASGP